jgi:hypothetical protein
MDSRFDGVYRVKRIVREWYFLSIVSQSVFEILRNTYHKVALNKFKQMRESFSFSVMCGSLHLVLVKVEPCDVGTGELDNLSGWTTHTTTDVEYLHALLDTDTRSEVVFVSSYSAVEGLAVGKAAEVEALTPSILV